MSDTKMEDEISAALGDNSKIIDQINQAAQTYGGLKAAFLDHFIFDGAALSEWTQRLAIAIPDDPTPDDMKRLWVSVTKKIQVAGHYVSISAAIASALDNGNKGRKADVVTAITQWYDKGKHKRPAGTIIESMAESYMQDTLGAKAAAIIVKNFWRQRLDTLIDMRKTLEQLGINMNVERKYEHS